MGKAFSGLEGTMKRTSELQRAVLDELRWEPSIDAGQIGVSVTDGVVTLSGHVGSYAEKWAAEKAAKRVAGVRALANDLVVRFPASAAPDDTDVARAVLNTLKWHTTVPDEKVRVTVVDGWVRLEGEVGMYYQKDAAQVAVRHLRGVKGVVNRIEVRPKVGPTRVKESIEEAFRRSATIDPRGIEVTAAGSKVTLRGRVRSWEEYEDAAWAAWSAQGVVQVENELVVEEAALAV